MILEPVQMSRYPRTTCADSRCPRTPVPISRCPRTTCADSRCPTITCAYSTTTCAYSRCPRATCADSRCPRTCADSSVTSPRATCADSTTTCADSRCPEHVQIPMSQVPQPPMQILPEPMNILHVSEPVQIPDDPEPVQIPVSQVPQPPMQILPEPMNILHVPNMCRFQCHKSHSHQILPEPMHSTCSTTCAHSSVTSPTATYADSPTPINILHVSEPVQIPVSQVPQSPVQILHVSEPVQIPVSQVPQSPVQSLPEPMQHLPELDMLDPLESTDAFDQLMSFVFGPQELQLLHTVPSIFDGDLFSFLDEFEREPMDLTMPRVNSCVKKSIGFKPIQPMDLSVNSQ
ncbi:hypothetical protein TNCV_1994791 [Trichonephila clavipes]|uniref:Uncharacterized protein n=1 Tax=Trichonephila clavipes TaxID=2585209 RepID=A0A8X6R6A6_TRICX|nr:hypothetical protein TNCV_1994791 [Trichonephila clavipes]